MRVGSLKKINTYSSLCTRDDVRLGVGVVIETRFYKDPVPNVSKPKKQYMSKLAGPITSCLGLERYESCHLNHKHTLIVLII